MDLQEIYGIILGVILKEGRRIKNEEIFINNNFTSDLFVC